MVVDDDDDDDDDDESDGNDDGYSSEVEGKEVDGVEMDNIALILFSRSCLDRSKSGWANIVSASYSCVAPTITFPSWVGTIYSPQRIACPGSSFELLVIFSVSLEGLILTKGFCEEIRFWPLTRVTGRTGTASGVDFHRSNILAPQAKITTSLFSAKVLKSSLVGSTDL